MLSSTSGWANFDYVPVILRVGFRTAFLTITVAYVEENKQWTGLDDGRR